MTKKKPGPVEPTNFRNRIVGLEYVATADLLPHPDNWRTHPQSQARALLGILADVGIANALLAYRSEAHGGALVVIDGHLRRDAAPQQWPVLLLDVNDEEARYILATHDPLTAMATADAEALRALLDTVQTDDAAVRDILLAQTAAKAGLFIDQDPDDFWLGMPEYQSEGARESYRDLIVHFTDEAAVQNFAALLGQPVTAKTRSLWYPERPSESNREYQIVDTDES